MGRHCGGESVSLAGHLLHLAPLVSTVSYAYVVSWYSEGFFLFVADFQGLCVRVEVCCW